MSRPTDLTDQQLLDELARRGSLGACPTCQRWKAYVGVWDHDGRTLRCGGCLLAVGRCTCR